jgi:hypothetical protein
MGRCRLHVSRSIPRAARRSPLCFVSNLFALSLATSSSISFEMLEPVRIASMSDTKSSTVLFSRWAESYWRFFCRFTLCFSRRFEVEFCFSPSALPDGKFVVFTTVSPYSVDREAFGGQARRKQCRIRLEGQGRSAPLWWAAVNGHEAIVKQLLDTGKVDANSKDWDGRTPKYGVVWYKSINVLPYPPPYYCAFLIFF